MIGILPAVRLGPGEQEIDRVLVWVTLRLRPGEGRKMLHVTDRRLIIANPKVSPFFAAGIPVVCLIFYGIAGAAGAIAAFATMFYLIFLQRPVLGHEIALSDVASASLFETNSYFDRSRVIVISKDGAQWTLRSSQPMKLNADDIIEALGKANLKVVCPPPINGRPLID